MNAIELEQRLLADHKRLEGLCLGLEAAFADDDAQLLWADLERSLEVHFLVEESALFPRYAHYDPLETRALSAEHRLLRARLGELKLLRAPLVRDFLAMLRAHAAREDAALYRWACDVLHAETAAITSALQGPGATARR